MMIFTIFHHFATIIHPFVISDQDVAYTCENAQHFFLHHVQYRWEDFHRKLKIAGKDGASIHKVWKKWAQLWIQKLGFQNANLTGGTMIESDDE